MRRHGPGSRLLPGRALARRRHERLHSDPGNDRPDEPVPVLRRIQHGPLAGPQMEETQIMAELKDHIVLVTGALGTLGSAMCAAIAAAGGTAIRSDLAARGAV